MSGSPKGYLGPKRLAELTKSIDRRIAARHKKIDALCREIRILDKQRLDAIVRLREAKSYVASKYPTNDRQESRSVVI